ncbi:MAG: 3-oxoacyl-ACP reductase FabG [Tepidisphaeraceae bacterium]
MSILAAVSDSNDFAGKVVLVTGSSRGIGAGIVRAFGKGGARGVVNYVADPQGKNEADARIVAVDLAGALLIEGDVGDDAAVAAMMARVRAECGGLDILVNNAGILRDRTLKKMSADEWETVLRVNLTGAANCIRHATGILRDDGRIVNIASVSGVIGIYGQANYAASKAGLIGLTKVAARELAKHRITVNAVAPGVVDTDMMRSVPDDARKQLIAQIPLGRMGAVEDIVNAVLFLASSRAGYITGQVIHVNGGFFIG